MSRGSRESSRPPSNYTSRRYQDQRDTRDYEDKREKIDRMYDDKIYDRSDRLPPQSMLSQAQPSYSSGRYDVRRTQSSSFIERFPRQSKKYISESQPDRDLPRRSPDSQGKRDRSPSDYVTETEKIADIIKKEYQVNPPIQLNLAPPVLLDTKTWD